MDINIPTLVSQTITNGVTAFAPSEDAVFDALALKQNLLYRSITVIPSATLTGTTTETELLKITIPANTLSANEIIQMLPDFIRSGVNNLITIRFKMSTSSTMPPTTTGQFAVWTVGTGSPSIKVRRRFKIYGGNLVGFTNTTSSVTDEGVINAGLSSQAFDNTVTNYFYISATLLSASDSIYLNQCLLHN